MGASSWRMAGSEGWAAEDEMYILKDDWGLVSRGREGLPLGGA